MLTNSSFLSMRTKKHLSLPFNKLISNYNTYHDNNYIAYFFHSVLLTSSSLSLSLSLESVLLVVVWWVCVCVCVCVCVKRQKPHGLCDKETLLSHPSNMSLN